MKHYYRINSEKYQNAIEAWSRIRTLERAGAYLDYELVLHEGKLANYDWTIPVVTDIRILEEQFATKIREENKYVRLLYSGGSDSHSIADAFLRSGNRIDEYVMYSWESMYDDCLDSPFNVNMKIRWLMELHEKYNMPFTKMTVMEVGREIHETFFEKNWYLKHAGHAGTESFNVNHLGDMAKFAPLPPSVTDYVEVLGKEKPRIFSDGNEIWYQMNDKNTMYSASPERNNIWFYLSPEAPELIRAQCQGAIAVARGLFPNLPFAQAIHKLQNDRNFYHEWCTSVGRVTTRFQNSFIIKSKNVGQSLTNNHRYHHVDNYAADRNPTWKNYEDYINVVRDLSADGTTLPGINTQKFILERLCSQ
jgi:DNA-binding Lrp family transcriptional regulator